MKKIFSSIVLLVILSLAGLVYLQYEWIKGAMILKKEQYQRDVVLSLNNIRDTINIRKDKGMGGYSFPFQVLSFSRYLPTASVVKNNELKEIIGNELKAKNINQAFEFCITNEARLPVMFSTGYKTEYLTDANNFSTMLSGDNLSNNEMLNVYISEPENYFNGHLISLILFALFFTGVIIAAFFITIRTMLSQKKLSEIKSDFINNMTHEFKTPIATIQLASDALMNQKVKSDHEQIEYYTGIIKEENKRMNKQVERILQASQLERDELKMEWKDIDVNDVVVKMHEYTKLQMEEMNIRFNLHLHASKTKIKADEVHFTNIVFNLIDNAMKYSKPEQATIDVTTGNVADQVFIQIRDNGIGMDKETQQNVYEKFYRAHTGNLHNVKGFGLGLTYVKKIVEAHKGKIELQSELGKGTTFTISFQTV